MVNENVDNQFIFREVEFEDDKFHAASFVAKYRRVTSLESLRDQLRLYCDALKQQLYGIINRDYKDFITIATKLDGVDVRAEHLRKPLIDLRLNLAALHDGMVSSMQTIEDKLRHREEVVTKRRILEATLACMEKLDTAEEIVLNVQQQNGLNLMSVGETSRGNGLRRRALLKSFAKSQGVTAFSHLSRDVFDCSELERAAHSAAQAQRFLSILSLSAGGGSINVNQRMLEQRLHKLTEQLVQRVRARLSAIFSSAVSASSHCNGNSKASESGEGATEMSSGTGFPSRAFAHCLRALVALSRGEVAEEVVADTVTRPLAKPFLTQGRVDDTGGRGSYLGLQSALESLAAQVMAALVGPLQAFDDTFPSIGSIEHDTSGLSSNSSSSSGIELSSTIKAPVPIDLIVKGVWLPVAALLVERFPGMFSVGIAGTLSRCYMAVETLVSILEKSGTKRDLASHPAVAQFHSSWKLDLYLQLRTQEIFGRLDRACQLVGQHGLVTKVMEDIYSPKTEEISTHVNQILTQTRPGATPGHGPVVSALLISQPPSLTLTLSSSELQAVRTLALPTSPQLHLSLSEAFCTEIATCLHPSVALRALSTRFFVVAIRLIIRFEAHAAVTAEVPTPSFPKSALTALLLQQNGAHSNISGTPMSTPIKGTPSYTTPSPVAGTSGHSASQPPVIAASIDDLVLLASDLDTLTCWLGATFAPLAEKALGLTIGTDKSPVRCCLKQQQNCLHGTRVAVWGRVCYLIAADCKKGLAAVRAVAAKYRMTNKPAPDAPSAYVDIILQPFRSFLDRRGSLASTFAGPTDSSGASSGSWEESVLEDVTAGYLMQVQALMETVKQMDSALQRRSKLRTAAPVGTNMADSDKISLQLFLDVRAYGQVVSILSPKVVTVPSYTALVAEVASAEKLLLSASTAS